jgi:hypothetical protein
MVDGVRVETLERTRLDKQRNRFSGLAAAPGLRRHLAAAWAMWEQASFGEEYDVVEACDWGLLFVPPAVEAKRPLVVQCHGSVGQIADHDPISGEETEHRMVQLIERAVMARATVQTCSYANAEFWAAETGRRVDVIRPALSLAVASEQPVGPRGLVIGRVQVWKGPHIVCAALKLLGVRAPEIEWFGRDTLWENPGSSSASHLAAAFPGIWGTKVIHYAPVPPEEVARRQASALFNLIPSTWDTFNFTVVEAMASGRPTVVSTAAGASELVEDGVSGFLFTGGDVEALAATIERVMSESPARLAEIGEAAQETIRRELDPEKIVAERIAAYRAAIADFERNPPQAINGWLGDICRPSAVNSHDSMTFLDHHPLRSILSYSARRLRRQLWPQ